MNAVTPLPARPDGRRLVAGEVKAWMARRGLNQMAVAAAMGITQSQLSKRLNGKIPLDVDELYDLAEVLGVDVPVLFGGFESPRGPDGPGGAGGWHARRDSNSQPSDP